MILLAIVIWIAFCLADGLSDAFTFHKAALAGSHNNKILGVDVHVFYTIKRACVVCALALFVGSWLLIPVLGCLQPLFHNGMYFQIRNVLDKLIYPEGFKTTITRNQSSALLNFDVFSLRLILAFLGIGIIMFM